MTTYYVDATTGSDSDDGLSEADAWQTVNKVNSSSFSAGDFIGFKRGETFRHESDIFIIDQGGSSGNHVTYGAYGTGDRPIISCARVVTGWASTTGEEYKADLLTSQGPVDPRTVWQGTTQLLVGSEGSLAQGEYYYDAAADELHVRTTTGADPSGFTIEAANIRNAIYIQASYVTVEDLVLEKGNTYNLDISAQATVLTDITIQRVDSNRSAWHDVRIGDSGSTNTPNNVTLDDCVIYMFSMAEGVITEDGISHFEGNGTHGNNLTIKNCTIESDVGWGVDLSTGRNGIYLGGGDDHVIENNDITGVDHGITMDNTIVGWTIRYNFIHEIGDDGFEIGDVASSSGLIYSNIIYKTSDQFFGISSTGTVNFGGIYHNTCYRTVNHGIRITCDSASGGAIKNNLFGVSNTDDQRFYWLADSSVDITDFDIDYNFYYDYVNSPGTAVFAFSQSSGNTSWAEWQALGLDANGAVGDLILKNPGSTSADGYKIKATSPAIDAVLDVGVARDYFGNPRPKRALPDAGAYEFPVRPTSISLPSWSAFGHLVQEHNGIGILKL